MLMSRGRKPLPTEIKMLKGTAQKCRINPNEMKVDKVSDLPEAPEQLTEVGRDMWYKVCNQLKNNNLLSSVDYEMILAYCHQMSVYLECIEKVKTQGMVVKVKTSDYPINNPFIGIGNKALKAALEIGSSFGITPSARTKIQANKTQEQNPLRRILNG